MQSDHEFVSGLYKQYEQMLYRVAFNILRNSADAEDAVQECFVRVVKNLDKIYAVPCNELRFYLVIIVRNTALTMLKQKKRTAVPDNLAELDVPAEFTPEEEFLRKFSVEEIRSAVQQLSVEDCEVLWLLLFREYSAAEIAEIIGQKPVTVRSRICRARKRLIKQLEERGITAEHV